MPEPIPYQCFLSYAHSDNDDHDKIVDRLAKELAGRFEATTGSKLNIFLDRESIGWGEQWREKIAGAIAGSTLFIPVVTMRYFNRESCRDEFSAFHAAAVQRGVPDLILPIILAGSEYITPDHNDELVRAVEKLNYEKIREAFEAGYQSPEWKKAIGILVSKLQKALAKAADRLVETAPNVGTESPSPDGGLPVDVDEQSIENHIENLTALLEKDIVPLFEKFTAIAESHVAGRDLSTMTTGQRAFFFGVLADDLREPAREFGEKTSNLESTARRADAELRAYVAELFDIDRTRAEQELATFRSAVEEGFTVFEEFGSQTDELEKSLRIAALSNVKLRRALAPITAGVRSLNTTVAIVSSWLKLGR